MMLRYVIHLNAYELGQIMGAIDPERGKNMSPRLQKKIKRVVDKLYA